MAIRTVRENVEASIQSNIEYYTGMLVRTKAQINKKEIFDIPDKIDAMIAVNSDGIISVDATPTRIILTFENETNARKFASRFVDKFGLSEIQKSFHTYGQDIQWYYRHEFDNTEIKIYPAEPSPDCTPIKVREAYTKDKWVCSQTGKEL